MEVRGGGRLRRRVVALVGALAVTVVGSVTLSPAPAGATTVSNEAGFRAAWTNVSATKIDLTIDITLTCTGVNNDGVVSRNSSTAITVDGHGHTITQTCANGTNNGVLESIGSGAVTLQNVTITGGNTSSSSVLPNRAGGVYTNASLTLSNCTVSNNHATSAGLAAGGVLDEGGTLSITGCTLSGNTDTSVGEVGGAAVFEGSGPLNITDSALTGNTATAAVVTPPHGSDVAGGVVNNGIAINITRSSITSNHATGINVGGGVVNEAGTETTVNSTISGNTATANSTSDIRLGASGGILNQGGPETLVYVTLDGNTGTTGAMNDAANYVNMGGIVHFFGSVVGDPSGGPNCLKWIPPAGTPPSFVSNGHNLEDDSAATCGFSTATQDIVGQSPQLNAPANNSGPGPTQLPQSTSPLIDAIPTASCQADGASGVTTDERAITRPQGSGCDTGAVEVQASPSGCVTGSHPGAVTLSAQNPCVNGASIGGNLTIQPGTDATITNSSIGGAVSANGGGTLTLCGSHVGGNLSVRAASGFVLIGDTLDDGCAGNSIGGAAQFSSDHAGVELGQNTIGGNVTLNGNSGGGPFAEDAHPEVEANTIRGSLACTNDSPVALDNGPHNTVSGTRSGECAASGF